MKPTDDIMIKICGVANLEDALYASQCGADIIGVVLDPTVSRHGDSGLVTDIHSAGIKTAGVYTSLDAAMNQYGDEDFIQLHFPHSPETVRTVKKSTGKEVISVVQFSRTDRLEALAMERYSTGADIVLLENRAGIMENLAEIGAVQKTVRTGVAGKITPKDAGALIHINPLMIDLSSSVESSPGKKDHVAVAELFHNLEAA